MIILKTVMHFIKYKLSPQREPLPPEISFVDLIMQSKFQKIRIRENSEFGNSDTLQAVLFIFIVLYVVLLHLEILLLLVLCFLFCQMQKEKASYFEQPVEIWKLFANLKNYFVSNATLKLKWQTTFTSTIFSFACFNRKNI